MKKLIPVFLLLLIFHTGLLSQDTLLMMNGQYKFGNVDTVCEEYVKLTVTKKNNKMISRYFDTEDIFSITSSGGCQHILYEKDNDENALTPLQMRSYLSGVQDAKENYHAPLVSVGGFAMGITGGVYGFWGAMVPTSYVFIAGAGTPKCKDVIVSEIPEINYIAGNLDFDHFVTLPEYLPKNYTERISQNEYYKYGYRSKAKDKKVKNAMKGGIVGFFTAVALSFILIN